MNTNSIPQYIIRFIAILIFQAWVFNNIDLLGFINPSVYILFILILPIDIKMHWLLFIGFTTGLVQDMFINTGGIHTFATTTIAYIRGLMLQNAKTTKDAGAGSSPSAYQQSWRWYVSYAALLVYTHAFLTSLFDVFALRPLPILLQTLANGTLTLVLILGAEFIFRRDPA